MGRFEPHPILSAIFVCFLLSLFASWQSHNRADNYEEAHMHAQSAGIRAHYMVIDSARMLARWRQ